MPGVGLIRSKLRPSRWLSPKSKQSFTKRRLLITASSKSFSARCANSVSKSSSDRHRESANAPAANIPKVPYLSAIPLIALGVSPSARGFTASELARQVRLLSNQTESDYGPRRAAYDLKQLRAKHTVQRIGQTRT